jgi:hypothetical protein
VHHALADGIELHVRKEVGERVAVETVLVSG